MQIIQGTRALPALGAAVPEQGDFYLTVEQGDFYLTEEQQLVWEDA